MLDRFVDIAYNIYGCINQYRVYFSHLAVVSLTAGLKQLAQKIKLQNKSDSLTVAVTFLVKKLTVVVD